MARANPKTTSQTPWIISAVMTPLADDESVQLEALEAHLDEQWKAGINGLLVAGSMGEMQLLTDQAYKQLIENAVRFCAGRGEVMVGVGDTSLARTLQRVELLNNYQVDAAVVLTPYFCEFRPIELVDYYHALAKASRHPVFLYDLPVVTKVKLDFETVERAAEHPNIHGIKASCKIEWAKELLDRMRDRLRIIVAQPRILDVLLREGVMEHLDGMYAVAPRWTMEIVRASQAGDWQRAAAYQKRLVDLLEALLPYDVLPGVTVLFKARGIPGKIGASPARQLDAAASEKLLAQAIIREFLADHS